MMDAKKIAIAKRCQLLTGSFDDKLMVCPCNKPADCVLSAEEREILSKHPDIVDARERNRIDYLKRMIDGEVKIEIVDEKAEFVC